MLKNPIYLSGEEIHKGDLITIDFGYEHCIILKTLFKKGELQEWGWLQDPGAGVFAYSYRSCSIEYIPIDILTSDETKLLGRCDIKIYKDDLI